MLARSGVQDPSRIAGLAQGGLSHSEATPDPFKWVECMILDGVSKIDRGRSTLLGMPTGLAVRQHVRTDSVVARVNATTPPWNPVQEPHNAANLYPAAKSLSSPANDSLFNSPYQ